MLNLFYTLPVALCGAILALVMDPITAFGVATGVIGLVPLCAQGFNMVKDCFRAPEGVQESMTQILLQRAVFLSWAEPLGLLPVTNGKTLSKEDEKKVVEMLKRGVPNWNSIGNLVLDVLASMSDTFADAESLEKKYGLGLWKRGKVCRPCPFLIVSWLGQLLTNLPIGEIKWN